MKTTNKALQEAYNGLVRLGESDIPLRPSVKLALVKINLRPLAEALEEARIKLLKAHRLTSEDLKGVTDGLEQQSRLEAFTEEWGGYLKEEVEWETSHRVSCKKLVGCKSLRFNDLSALIAVGILVDADVLEEIKDE